MLAVSDPQQDKDKDLWFTTMTTIITVKYYCSDDNMTGSADQVGGSMALRLGTKLDSRK